MQIKGVQPVFDNYSRMFICCDVYVIYEEFRVVILLNRLEIIHCNVCFLLRNNKYVLGHW